MKNQEYEAEGMIKNIFNDEHFSGPPVETLVDGKPNVSRFVKPFELRVFDLKKQAYTI